MHEFNEKNRLQKREKNLVETDQLLMEKLHTNGEKIGRISLHSLIIMKYIIQW